MDENEKINEILRELKEKLFETSSEHEALVMLTEKLTDLYSVYIEPKNKLTQVWEKIENEIKNKFPVFSGSVIKKIEPYKFESIRIKNSLKEGLPKIIGELKKITEAGH